MRCAKCLRTAMNNNRQARSSVLFTVEGSAKSTDKIQNKTARITIYFINKKKKRKLEIRDLQLLYVQIPRLYG